TTEYALLYPEWLRDRPHDATATTRPANNEVAVQVPIPASHPIGGCGERWRRIVTHVALLGFGTVGSAVARRLTSPDKPQALSLTHIFDRRPDLKRQTLAPSGSTAPICWTSEIDDILQSDVDVVVEAIGGTDPTSDWVREALTAGKSVVTANKQLIA